MALPHRRDDQDLRELERQTNALKAKVQGIGSVADADGTLPSITTQFNALLELMRSKGILS